MQLYFDFGDLANSLLYLGCGLQLILVFLLLSAASKAGIRTNMTHAILCYCLFLKVYLTAL